MVLNVLDELSQRLASEIDSEIIQAMIDPQIVAKENTMPRREITVTITKKITKCYHECPYFTLDGGPGAAMYCSHPDLGAYPNGYIISHPECVTGFPSACPLLKGN